MPRFATDLLPLGLVALGACLATGASADPQESPMDRVHFQVEREAEVANDRVVAIVGVSDEDSDAPRLSARINETMRWALERAKRSQGVEVESGGYQTSAVYDKGKIRRWRGSQDLRLEAEDVALLSELVGDLQERLLVRSISFYVSPERRREAEDELIGEALGAFQERARKIGAGLGARGHALVDLHVDTGRQVSPMPRMRTMAAESMADVSPPALEGGKSTITVTVRGSIELER